jgi:hypothetical protein
LPSQNIKIGNEYRQPTDLPALLGPVSTMSVTIDQRPRASHIWPKDPLGFYVEPAWCSERLFEVESFVGPIWDPCCGFGNIPEAARAAGYHVFATDLINRGYRGLDGVADFLQCDRPANVVCNPPYDLSRAFALHALKVTAGKVAMISLVRRLNAAGWLKDTPLARVYFLSPRPSIPPGSVIAAGEKPGGGKQDFVWLVWDRDHAGAPTLHWLYRDRKDR